MDAFVVRTSAKSSVAAVQQLTVTAQPRGSGKATASCKPSTAGSNGGKLHAKRSSTGVQTRIDDGRRLADAAAVADIGRELRELMARDDSEGSAGSVASSLTAHGLAATLRRLEALFVHHEILEETRIGTLALRLTRHPHSEVAAAASTIYLRWQADVAAARALSGCISSGSCHRSGLGGASADGSATPYSSGDAGVSMTDVKAAASNRAALPSSSSSSSNHAAATAPPEGRSAVEGLDLSRPLKAEALARTSGIGLSVFSGHDLAAEMEAWDSSDRAGARKGSCSGGLGAASAGAGEASAPAAARARLEAGACSVGASGGLLERRAPASLVGAAAAAARPAGAAGPRHVQAAVARPAGAAAAGSLHFQSTAARPTGAVAAARPARPAALQQLSYASASSVSASLTGTSAELDVPSGAARAGGAAAADRSKTADIRKADRA